MQDVYAMERMMSERVQEWQEAATLWRAEKQLREAEEEVAPAAFSGRTLFLSKAIRSRRRDRFNRDALRIGPLEISWRWSLFPAKR